MIVVDTSTLIAILDDSRYVEATAEADSPLASVATVVESGIVKLSRRDAKSTRNVNARLTSRNFRIRNGSPSIGEFMYETKHP